MKILVVGGSGMLGQDLVAEFERRDHAVLAPSSSELDITDPTSAAAVSAYEGVAWCVNCAAYTAVDKAEEEVQQATELNALAPSYLARACAMAGIKLLHVSTDFVFDGQASDPYTEEGATNPLGVYGRTKRDGEEAILAALPIAVIFRTAWLYGARGKNFAATMINAWKAEKTLRVVDDQIGSPTYTGDLARTIVDAIETDIFPGVYHATGPDAMSWRQFAIKAIEAYRTLHGIDRAVEIAPIRTEDWPTPATRPKYSVLSNAKLQAAGIAPMRPTDESLADFVSRLPQ